MRTSPRSAGRPVPSATVPLRISSSVRIPPVSQVACHDHDVIEALGWGLLGASSLLIGCLLVFARPPSSKVLGLVMGFGAGVLMSAVSFELVEEAVDTEGGLGNTALGFFTGAVIFFAGDVAIARMGNRTTAPAARQPARARPACRSCSVPCSTACPSRRCSG